jgi:ligand-binding sensor domain-containing protein
MIKILDISNSKNFFTALLVLLSLCFFACSKEEEKKNSMLDEFNDSSSVIVPEDPSELKENIKDNDIEEGKAVSHEEILGDKSQPEEKKTAPSILPNIELNLSAAYKKLHQFNFTPVEIHKVSESELIVIGTNDVRSFSLENNTEKVLLSKEMYKTLFKKEMPLITASYLMGADTLMIGFINGEVLEYNGVKWTVFEGGPAYSGDRINAILEHDGRILVASKGIYIWDTQLKKFMSSQDSKKYNITSITTLSPALVLLGTSQTLLSLSFPAKTFSKFYDPLATEKPILHVKDEGESLLVGTIRGLIRISRKGEFISRFSSNFSVSKIEKVEKDKYFVVTDKGLGLVYKDEVMVDDSLEGGKVTSLTAGTESSILIGLINGELVSVSYDKLLGIVNQIRNKQKIEETFSNACHAYLKLLNSTSYSHLISAASIDQKDYVFIDGKQVCPNGIGFMHNAGSALVYADKVLKLSNQGATATIKLSEELEKLKITSLLLLKDKKIYIGTENGLFVSGEKSWDKVPDIAELREDFISDIVEDQRGNVWVGTRLSEGKTPDETKDYHPLHVRVGDAWASFGPANGIRVLGISNLSFAGGDLLMASAVGFGILSPSSNLAFYGNATGLDKPTIESIVRDRRGRTWMSSGFFFNGISWIDEDRIYSIEEAPKDSEKAGLFSNRISKVGVDEQDRVWIVDSAGKTGVYDYETLKTMAVEKAFLPLKAMKEKFLP